MNVYLCKFFIIFTVVFCKKNINFSFQKLFF
nr:MAG TPA: hypothetical protein [Caudoviricetes sp.]